MLLKQSIGHAELLTPKASINFALFLNLTCDILQLNALFSQTHETRAVLSLSIVKSERQKPVIVCAEELKNTYHEGIPHCRLVTSIPSPRTHTLFFAVISLVMS